MALVEPVILKSRGVRLRRLCLGHVMHSDGTIRDTVTYSLRAGERPEAKAQLLYQLHKPRT